jgi:hypothetical protein
MVAVIAGGTPLKNPASTRDRWPLEKPRHVQDERRHRQAHDVVDKKRRQQSAGEDDRRQQVMWMHVLDDPFR